MNDFLSVYLFSNLLVNMNFDAILLVQTKNIHIGFYLFLQIQTNKTQSRKWADDSEVDNCMSCAKSFSVTVRKVINTIVLQIPLMEFIF